MNSGPLRLIVKGIVSLSSIISGEHYNMLFYHASFDYERVAGSQNKQNTISLKSVRFSDIGSTLWGLLGKRKEQMADKCYSISFWQKQQNIISFFKLRI